MKKEPKSKVDLNYEDGCGNVIKYWCIEKSILNHESGDCLMQVAGYVSREAYLAGKQKGTQVDLVMKLDPEIGVAGAYADVLSAEVALKLAGQLMPKDVK